MRIDSFVIGGIANIDNLSLHLEDMSALVAPNGYGKSNVLRSIGFGMDFLSAGDDARGRMLSSRFKPINNALLEKNFRFEIEGRFDASACIGTDVDEDEMCFLYGFECEWTDGDRQGSISAEWFKIKREGDQRYRQLINRSSANECLIVPSPTGRCNKQFAVSQLQLALPMIAAGGGFMSDYAKQICAARVPNLESLDNPENYFSADDAKGISMLDGMTLSEYMYKLKVSDNDSYSILRDGLLQLIPGIVEFDATEVTLSDGQMRIYDIVVKESYNAQPSSIRQLSSGSKRIIFLFTLCVAAQKRNIPLIMLEEPENSVHPRLMENLLLSMQSYASDTRILLTSHSPYLMRYLQPRQMYFGLPKENGVARFAQVSPSKLKYLYRYAGDMELTFGEFMFDFMLDIENDREKISTFFTER